MAKSLHILLLSPRGPLYRHRGGIWKKSLRYQPLTLTTLAALIPADVPATVTVLDEGIHDIDPDIQADLVGISAITGSVMRAYELADHFRRRGIPVVLGGVHPTLMPDEAAQHADCVVVGYAEDTWPQLLHDFCAGQMKPRYTQAPDLSLANRPIARRNLLPANHYVTPYTLEATRGCVHPCEFCVVPVAWGRKPYQRPVAEVVTEIKQMRARRILFLDLNLIADVDYAKELFTALIPLGLTWGGLTTTLVAWDEELLALLQRSGCKGLLLGLETLSQDSLTETHKSFGMKKDYFEVVRQLHSRKIAIMGCFAFGFDHDTPDTFAATVDFAIEAGIDLPRYAILTPFPGTALFNRLQSENRILTRDWSLYDAQHVVFSPQRMTPAQLQLGTEWAWKQTYSYGAIAKRLSRARIMLPLAIPANWGYRFYAHRLHQFYTCDWMFDRPALI